MSRRKLAVVLLTLVLAAALFANNGLAKDKVVFWSFAANNIEEWEARKAEIEKKFASPL